MSPCKVSPSAQNLVAQLLLSGSGCLTDGDGPPGGILLPSI